MAAALMGCSAQSVVKRTQVREQALILPEAVTSEELVADRVTVLTSTGKNLVYKNAIIGRDGGNLIVRHDGQPATIPVEVARAVQIERNLVGPVGDDMKRRAEHDEVDIVPTWTIVLGVLVMAAGVVWIVTEQDDSDF